MHVKDLEALDHYYALMGVTHWQLLAKKATLIWRTYPFWLFSRTITTIVVKVFVTPTAPPVPFRHSQNGPLQLQPTAGSECASHGCGNGCAQRAAIHVCDTNTATSVGLHVPWPRPTWPILAYNVVRAAGVPLCITNAVWVRLFDGWTSPLQPT
jgi:hypothetical protein